MYVRLLIISCLTLAIGLFGFLCLNGKTEKETLVLELGTPLANPDSHKINLPFETTASLTYKTSQLASKDAKVWLEAGQYTLTREDGKEVSILIQDRTPPTLSLKKTAAYCYVNDDLSQFDWKSYLHIEDYSATSVSYTLQINTATSGQGKVCYQVKDEAGNQSEISLPVYVIAKLPGLEDVDWLASYEMFDLQNQYRLAQGLNALQWNDDLVEMAYTRCAEITQRYSHIRPNGSSYTSLFSHAYDYHAENISACNKDAQGLFEDWASRLTFSANMLNEHMEQGIILHVKESWVALYTG